MKGCERFMVRLFSSQAVWIWKFNLPSSVLCAKPFTHVSCRTMLLEQRGLLNDKMIHPTLFSVVFKTVQPLHTEGSGESHPLTTEEDLVTLTKEIIRKAAETDVMVSSVSPQQVEQLVLNLHNLGLQGTDILSTLSTKPAYIINHRKLLPITNFLLGQGLDVQQVVTILHQFPAILQIPVGQVGNVIDALREGRFSEDSINKIVSTYPVVLTLSSAKLVQRVTDLRQWLKTTDVIRVVTNCPPVLTEDWEDLQAKFDYVFHEMNITQKQMVYATLFSHSLSHIKKRHAFLVRAGFFDMEKRKEGEKSPNARLDQIISSSDKAFCRRFGGFELAEYRAFCQLYDKEQSALVESDSDSDSE